MKWLQEKEKVTGDRENRQHLGKVLLKREKSNGNVKNDVGSIHCGCCCCLLFKSRGNLCNSKCC